LYKNLNYGNTQSEIFLTEISQWEYNLYKNFSNLQNSVG